MMQETDTSGVASIDGNPAPQVCIVLESARYDVLLVKFACCHNLVLLGTVVVAVLTASLLSEYRHQCDLCRQVCTS